MPGRSAASLPRINPQAASDRDTEEVRALAREGTLAATVANASASDSARLIGAAYRIAWPVVFTRLTQGIERRRGHATCAISVVHLADDCLDRFEDDVEAVVHDVVHRTGRPIRNLEAWIASRINAATVDGYRRRRGDLGALQRPRPPKWLVNALGGDPWLVQLATQMLIWVGHTATAGVDVWPTEAWAHLRSQTTGDWSASSGTDIRQDIDAVLDAMRQRPTWYAAYVERPLGRKQAPVLRFSTAGQHTTAELPSLALVDRAELDDARMRELAHEAVLAIRSGLSRGEPPEAVVVSVIQVVFGLDDNVAFDQPPHSLDHHDERIDRILQQRSDLDQLVAAVLAIVAEPEPG